MQRRVALVAVALAAFCHAVRGWAPTATRHHGATRVSRSLARLDRLAAPLSISCAARRVQCSAAADGFNEPLDNGIREGPDWLVRERDACGVGFVVGAPDAGPTYSVLERTLNALACMEHRGACGGDGKSGDGAGVMTQIPWGLIEADLPEVAEAAPRTRRGVAQVFLPDPSAADNAGGQEATDEARAQMVAALEAGGMRIIATRTVPVDKGVCGVDAAAACPLMEQIVFESTQDNVEGDALENALYVIRRTMPDAEGTGESGAYVASISSRTIVYKGMLTSCDLRGFYDDLRDERFETQFAIYHRRFSTNTKPRWPLAQPMRMMGHNGEINTLTGNIGWARAHASTLPTCDPFAAPEDNLQCDVRVEGGSSLVDDRKSDSANLDAVFESFVRGGMAPTEAMMALVPEAYRGNPSLLATPEVEEFYRFFEPMQEAWDGPALLVYSDGLAVGAQLDRNGLRPARFARLADGTVYLMSETGVVPWDEAEVVEKGRLGPGQGIAVGLNVPGCDVAKNKLLAKGECLTNFALKSKVASRRPYGEWLKSSGAGTPLPRVAFSSERAIASDSEAIRHQTAFGWGSEDVDIQIADMAGGGMETTYCMGDDAPLAVLSTQPRVMYDYFRQRFAQVTNPAIDPLREGSVMSLALALGERPDPLLYEGGQKANYVRLDSPIVHSEELDAVRERLSVVSLSTRYDGSAASLAAALSKLSDAAVAAADAGHRVIILSDRHAPSDLRTMAGADENDDAGRATPFVHGGADGTDGESYIPPLLAVGAVHHAMLQAGMRTKASLVVETAQAWSTHHMAVLLGYGASAVHPYMAFDAVRQWRANPKTLAAIETGKTADIDVAAALANYRGAIEKGLKKILAKMGISLLSSYTGAQIFEAIGIGGTLIDTAFVGTPSRVGGMDVADVEAEMKSFVKRAATMNVERTKLENYGLIRPMPKLEYHANSPALSKLLHKAVRGGPDAVDQYELFKTTLNEAPLLALRDLLDVESDRKSVPLDDVEPLESIMARFCTGGMSLGALSREAHETLAIAMNRIGGRSNSGEGGEDAARDEPVVDADEHGKSAAWPHLNGLHNGDLGASKIRQLASGRFGVTTPYLANARQLEIKLAQGAKPGEGGQLPGKKVDAYIAGLRASTPGVTLISPPPHHDIYSIEDLAQLIYDLKAVNPRAPVSVKLVASVGIGTVACGVAKASADVIQISGHDGGTGASPVSSIKHAGAPWELGLTDSHRMLCDAGLRDKVALRVDGGIRTGWDVLMAALLGGQEFGFGTVAMIAEGCIMARVCHTNSCPAGIATQEQRLRARFPGTPGHVVEYFSHVAGELRGLMASMGYTSLDELIGRSDLLVAPDARAAKVTKTANVATEFVTRPPLEGAASRAWNAHVPNHESIQSIGSHHDERMLAAHPELEAALEAGGGDLEIEATLNNLDRAAFTRIAGTLAYRRTNLKDGAAVSPAALDGQMRFKLSGCAGQSFGAFLVEGMHLRLSGESNDYVGKGMHGGTIAIAPPPEHGYVAGDATIIGNTCLYGATKGALFAAGRAGERFGVRNSGALAVVEGVGDHALEYMTGGVIVVLGGAGRNIGAGMTGGLAYFLDAAEGEPSDFPLRLNDGGTFKTQRVTTAAGDAQLKGLIERHVAETGSARGAELLADWPNAVGRFIQVYPDAESHKPEVTEPIVVEAEQGEPAMV